MIFSSVQARPLYLYQLAELYPQSRGLVSGCSVCHSVGKEYTTYGQDFLVLFKRLGPEKLPQLWCELGLMNSFHEQLSNDEHLRNYPSAPRQ